MNYTNLNKLYWLKKKIDSIKQDLEEISNLGSAPITDMPRGTGKSDPTERIALKKIKLQKDLNEKLEEYLEEYEKIRDYIESIQDISVQVIARRRFIKNETWEEIGKSLSYDGTWCYRKLINYINSENTKNKRRI